MANKSNLNICFRLLSFWGLAILYFYGQECKAQFYLPAEWEPQAGIISGYEDSASFEMVSRLSRETKIYCMVTDSTKDSLATKFSEAGIPMDSIHFMISPREFNYANRDGLMFLKNESGELRAVNFAWNCYGWYFKPEFESYLEPDKLARGLYTGILCNTFPYPVISSPMVNEGGAIETNGKGTILQVESVNMQRNPDMTKEAQEAELKRVLNAKKIIWLKEGAAEDPSGWGTHITDNYFGVGVNGHLDEFCRFVNDSTILISYPDSAEAEQDPVKKLTLERMKVNYEILKNATDQDGQPFTVVKMPVPDIDYMTFALDTAGENEEIRFLSGRILYEQKSYSIGDTVHFVPACSYMNFLVTNKTVFAAKYWSEGKPESSKAKDKRARDILARYFPDRTIYEINTEETNHNGGGLHCWTMQVPK